MITVAVSNADFEMSLIAEVGFMYSFADNISTLHTLGPQGTNCEAAAYEWFARQGREGKVYLHPTLEVAVEEMKYHSSSALLGCVVYPDLHTLVFSNLQRLKLIDCFVFSTHNMVLASNNGKTPESISTHPAPQELIPHWITKRQLVSSNAQAALNCTDKITDACITTIVAAKAHQLHILKDFGSLPMGYTIHVPIL